MVKATGMVRATGMVDTTGSTSTFVTNAGARGAVAEMMLDWRATMSESAIVRSSETFLLSFSFSLEASHHF